MSATFFREAFFAALDFTDGDFRVFRDIFLAGALWVLRVEAFLIRGAFFTAMAGLDLDFIVGAFMALRAGVFLDFRVVLGVAAFNFLIGVLLVSADLEVAFFLSSALALLFEAGDFGAAMVLWS